MAALGARDPCHPLNAPTIKGRSVQAQQNLNVAVAEPFQQGAVLGVQMPRLIDKPTYPLRNCAGRLIVKLGVRVRQLAHQSLQQLFLPLCCQFRAFLMQHPLASSAICNTFRVSFDRGSIKDLFARIAEIFGGRDGSNVVGTPSASPDIVSRIEADPYLAIADTKERLISIFDELRYDRADADIMSPPMRNRIVGRLAPLGFRQVSGSVIENKTADIRLIFPKFRALGASPFDAIRDTRRRAQDWFILTPTQTACQFIDTYPLEDAVERITKLIAQHPINIYRLMDYLERKERHQAFLPAIGHLKYVQRDAISREPLATRRALR